MARIKLGALITEMSGSIGGFTAQKSQYGLSLKTKSNPLRSLSQSQSVRRAQVSSLQPIWQGLNEAQRIQWNNYTSFNRQTAKGNSDSLLSGYNLFIKYNLFRLYLGLVPITSPSYGIQNFVNVLPLSASLGPSPLFLGGGVGDNTFGYSTDGSSWVAVSPSIFSNSAYQFAFNGSIWVAVGTGDNTLAYSYNGINWTGLGTSIFSAIGRDVCWDGSKFVAVGQGINSIAYSYNGIDWTGLGTSIFSTIGRSICFNGSLFVATGTGSNTLAYSSNGINWSGLGTSVFSTSGFDSCFASGYFYAVGSGLNSIARSSDGIFWSTVSAPFFTTGRSLCFNGSLLVAGGSGSSSLAYSEDGIRWTGLGTSIFSSNCSSIAFNGSLFIAVGSGSSNTIASSIDGINWSGMGNSFFTASGVGVGSYPSPFIIPSIPISNILFSSPINPSLIYPFVKVSQPANSPYSVLLKKLRAISNLTVSPSGISWGSSFESVWGVEPSSGQWISVEITFISLVSCIVYKPILQICQVQ